MRPRGFTLIELLVVIAIIAVLIGLSVPVLVASRERARVALCAATVRHLFLGLNTYDAANGTLPYGYEMRSEGKSAGRYAGFMGTIDLAGRWWFDRSEQVNHGTGDGLDALTCPSKRQGDFRLTADILCGNYGANLSLCRIEQYIKPYRDGFGGKPLSLSRIRRPGATLLLVDSGYALISWWHATPQPPVPLPPVSPIMGMIQHGAYVPGMGINQDKMLLPGQTEDAIGGRHPQKTVNVGFADGHVAAKAADDLLVERIDDERWDSGPLWDPCGDFVTAPAASP